MRLFSKRLTGAICAISKIFVKRWIDAIFVKISLRKSLIREFRRIWALPFVFCFLVFLVFFWGGGLNACQDGLWH